MKRIHAYELEDQPWFPDRLRRYITDILHTAQLAFGVHTVWAPPLARLIRQTGETHLVDLCSGGGGPLLEIIRRLKQDHGLRVTASLTDLYPNRTAMSRINHELALPGVRYLSRSVDATDVPEELKGIRTMFASFHHMPEDAARGILVDAFRKRQTLCICELTNNSPDAVLAYLVGIPSVTWAVTPLTRPLDWRRLLLTYVLPLVPAMVTWDGVASHLRTYSVAELKAMTADLQADDYQWEIGYRRHLPIPHRFPYLIGRPVAERPRP